MRLLFTVMVLFVLCASAGCRGNERATADMTKARAPLRVIIDTDANNELDDQHALAYALLNGGAFDIEAVTVNRTTSGGTIEDHMLEAERVVRLCGRYGRVPVLKGASGSFEEIANTMDRSDFDGAEAVNFIIGRAESDDGRPLVLLPIGKLTNIALALHLAPHISDAVRVVWLGSNYPEPGEYNQDNDEPALTYLLDSSVQFEIALVRYGDPSGTDAVRVTPAEINAHMKGKGPRTSVPVAGRNGGEFLTFGDYSVNLFETAQLYGNPPSRALFDLAAVAIVKDRSWATSSQIPAPALTDGAWTERPDNDRMIVLFENFDRDNIMRDFYSTFESAK